MDSPRSHDTDVVHRTFDTDSDEPNFAITETIAELKDVESDQLKPLYGCIDHSIDRIFSDPPSEGAEVTISFTYEGFRVTIDQDGNATFQRR